MHSVARARQLLLRIAAMQASVDALAALAAKALISDAKAARTAPPAPSRFQVMAVRASLRPSGTKRRGGRRIREGCRGAGLAQQRQRQQKQKQQRQKQPLVADAQREGGVTVLDEVSNVVRLSECGAAACDGLPVAGVGDGIYAAVLNGTEVRSWVPRARAV